MGLISIPYGSNASSQDLNSNFSYLEGKFAEDIGALEQTYGEELATLLSRMNTLENQINSIIDTKIANLTNAIPTIESIFSHKDLICTAIAPDRSKAVSIKSGDTMEKYGWVSWNGAQSGDSSTARLRINDVEVGYHNYYKYGDSYRMEFFVSPNDKITFNGKSSAKFFPCKGA